MTASEFRYLRAIESVKKEKCCVKMTDVAEKLCYARASVHKKLALLEQQGYVTKDGSKRISVTAKGIKEYRAVEEFVSLCADILSEKSGLDKKFVSHDAVEMACALSMRCRNALISKALTELSQHNLL